MSPKMVHDKLQPDKLQPTATPDSLLIEYAKKQFKNHFAYSYNSASTTPPDALSPANLSAADGTCIFRDEKQDHITEFMKKMLDAQNVPYWMHDSAQDDLLDWTTNVLGVANILERYHGALSKTYNPPDPSQQNSIRTDAIFAFTHTSVVCYIGVYYEVITPLAFVKQLLRTDAYNQASSITLNGEKAIVTDDISLTRALSSYTTTLFNDHFLYEWGQNPPHYINDGSYLKVNAVALAYFEDGNAHGVDWFVRDTLLKGISLPGWITDTTIADVVNTFTSIITENADSRSWIPVNIDKTYNDPTGIQNSLSVNAVVVYFSYSKTVHDGRVAKIVYIFWMGMIYEKLPLKTVVYNDMIDQLYGNLHSAMSNVSTDNLTSDKAGLVTLLSRCASSKFKSSFMYEFKGSSTTPGDSNGHEVYGVECFGEFEDMTNSDVPKWTKDEIFKDNTFSFFPSVSLLKSQLDQEILKWLTQNTSTTSGGNNWGINNFSHSYSNPSDDSKLLKTSGVSFFANGLLTESEFTVKSNFFYYTGVYYVADDDDDDEGV